jgi:dTDP-4-amino-4,6-dideoxygalactose transaminase
VPDVRVRFIDLQAQDADIGRETRAAVEEVLRTQRFILGPVVAAFEESLACYLGARHVVGVGSGTDALYLALAAAGIGPGDAVLTSPYSFVASASAIARAGARPYFADIEADSLNLDPAAAAAWLARACRRDGGVLRAPGGEAVRALLPVHLFGRPCAAEGFRALASAHGLALVEDAAQAIGARAPDGGHAGTHGRFGCFSFYPTKNLGAAGDGGAVVCADERDAERVRWLARHGAEGDLYRHTTIGLASRLDAIQAAVLEVKLRHVDRWNAARRVHAERYGRLLARAAGDRLVLPAVTPGHVFHHYVVRVRDRERVRAALAEDGIETQVYYATPLHLQPCFGSLGHREGDFPEAERASRETLALPIRPELSDEDAQAVARALARAVASA